jgi:hypothetical protein
MAELSLNIHPFLYDSFIDAVYNPVVGARCASVIVIQICPGSGTTRLSSVYCI